MHTRILARQTHHVLASMAVVRQSREAHMGFGIIPPQPRGSVWTHQQTYGGWAAHGSRTTKGRWGREPHALLSRKR